MRKPAALATLVLSLGFVAPATAATVDPHASCAGNVGAWLAGDPGARAERQFGAFADAAAYTEELGYLVPARALQSEFSSYHQPLEEC
jgi:hypothetical protein